MVEQRWWNSGTVTVEQWNSDSGTVDSDGGTVEHWNRDCGTMIQEEWNKDSGTLDQ